MATRDWGRLTPAYRARLERRGITRSSYEAGVSLSAARGHAATPERPERASRNPDKYRDYLGRKADLIERVKQRKERLWGDRLQYGRGAHSRRSVDTNPLTGMPTDTVFMRRFLKMSTDEAERIVSRVAQAVARDDHELDDWAFLFYH